MLFWFKFIVTLTFFSFLINFSGGGKKSLTGIEEKIASSKYFGAFL